LGRAATAGASRTECFGLTAASTGRVSFKFSELIALAAVVESGRKRADNVSKNQLYRAGARI
jgi:hypothetical protein